MFTRSLKRLSRRSVHADDTDIPRGKTQMDEHQLGIHAIMSETRWKPLEVLAKHVALQVHRVTIRTNNVRPVKHCMSYAQAHRRQVNHDTLVGAIQWHGNRGILVSNTKAHDGKNVPKHETRILLKNKLQQKRTGSKID
jgi:hypothetical protein